MDKFVVTLFIPIRKNHWHGNEYLATWEAADRLEICEFLARESEEHKVRNAHRNPVVRIAEFEIREI